jgi:hypothetical protein
MTVVVVVVTRSHTVVPPSVRLRPRTGRRGGDGRTRRRAVHHLCSSERVRLRTLHATVRIAHSSRSCRHAAVVRVLARLAVRLLRRLVGDLVVDDIDDEHARLLVVGAIKFNLNGFDEELGVRFSHLII